MSNIAPSPEIITTSDQTNTTVAYPYRWWITYQAKVLTPLSIGDGSSDINRVTDQEGNPHRHNCVAKDYQHRPYLVASGVKGALRALAETNHNLDITALFGAANNSNSKKEQRLPGCLDVHNAFLTNALPNKAQKEFQEHLAYADPERHSYIDVGTSIDCCTLTAKDRMLYNQERIAPGTCFCGSFMLQHRCFEKGTALVQQFYDLLQTVSTQQSLALGGDSGKGMGRVQFENISTKYFGPDQFKKWLAQLKGNAAQAKRWHESAYSCSFTANTFNTKLSPILQVNIRFGGLYLVNDPSRCNQDASAQSGTNKDPNHAPRLDRQGYPVLPASTLHGALRAQCQRILHTLQVATTAPLIRELFGETDYASGLRQVQPPQCVNPGTKHNQDFIAIDRFTGGGKDGAKFDAQAFYQPAFQAQFTIKEHVSPAARGLLLLALRDLAEGDIPLGWGKRKGYGHCKATANANKEALLTAAAKWLETTPIKNSEDENTPQSTPVDTTDMLAALRSLSTNTASVVFSQPDSAPNPNPPASAEKIPDHFHNTYHFVPIRSPDLHSWIKIDRQSCPIIAPGHHSHAAYHTTNATQQQAVYSGRIVCTITAETPMIVGGQRSLQDDGSTLVYPYRLPSNKHDGICALPASSLKGMIASVAEAASGSALRVMETEAIISYRMSVHNPYKKLGVFKWIENQWCLFEMTEFTVLDPAMAKHEYLKQRQQNKNAKSPILHALGILHLSGQLEPRPFPKNRKNEIQILNTVIKPNQPALTISDNAFLHFELLADECTNNSMERGDKTQKAINPEQNPEKKQALYTKAMQVLPYHRIKWQFRVTDNNPTGQWTHTKNAHIRNQKEDNTTRFEQMQLRPKDGDLVYYRAQGNTVTSFSYSQIWRDLVLRSDNKPARYTDFLPDITDTTDIKVNKVNTSELQPFNTKRQYISPAEILLGFVEIDSTEPHAKNTTNPQGLKKQAQALAFAGKLRFNDALPSRAIQPDQQATVLKILANPKPPSPALYFKPRQDKSAYIAKKDLNPQQHQINGRKQYLHALRDSNDKTQVQTLNNNGLPSRQDSVPPWQMHPKNLDPTTKKDQNAKQLIHAYLLPPQSQWHFHIDFDNLSHDELTLLMYSLRPDEQYRHKLGLGKSIGLGSVQINIDELALVNRLQRYQQDTIDEQRYHNTVSDHQQLAAWATQYRDSNKGDPQARKAQCILGDPLRVRHPVHVPQVKDRSIEKETFQWFGENDRPGNRSPQYLPPLPTNDSSIPTLKR